MNYSVDCNIFFKSNKKEGKFVVRIGLQWCLSNIYVFSKENYLKINYLNALYKVNDT
jgi:hypothetical protein